MKPFRILKNSIRDSFKSVFRNFSLSIASVMCTTITLILVAVAIIISVNVNYVTKTLEKELTIVVYVDKDTDSDKLKVIEQRIKSLSNVLGVEAKSKEEWKVEMKNYSDDLKASLDYLEGNPLLDSFVVRVKDVDNLSPTAKKIEEIDGVKNARYGDGMVENIVSIFNVIKTVTIVIVISLIVVTAFLIGNTIKLTIFSRRNEIEIMRLVGSSNISIKLPFIFEGFMLGIIGSLIPVMLTIYAYMIIYEKMGGTHTFLIFELVPPMPFVLYVSVILVVIGSIVGMFGSSRAVRKYLKI